MRLLLACSIAVCHLRDRRVGANHTADLRPARSAPRRCRTCRRFPRDVTAAVQRYQNYRAASFQDWLPDGSMLIATRFGATQQIHRVTAPGGARTQITFQQRAGRGAIAIPGTRALRVHRATRAATSGSSSMRRG